MPTQTARYAQVLVNVTFKAAQEPIFTYAIPEDFQPMIRVGQPVLVSFGQQDGVTGYVTALSDTYNGAYKVKEIADILDETPLFDEAYYRFIEWVADYYATPVSTVLDCAMPANLLQKPRKEVFAGPSADNPLLLHRLNGSDRPKAERLVAFLKAKTPDAASAKGYTPKFLAGQFRLSLKALNRLLARLKQLGLVDVRTHLSQATAAKTVKTVRLAEPLPADLEPTARHREIMDCLQAAREPLPLAELLAKVGTTAATVKKLESLGGIVITDEPVMRDPLAWYRKATGQSSFQLSMLQQKALDTILAGDESHPYLLYGVTGSGKTEVYLSLTRHAMEQGQSVLVLVPEIALTSQIARRFVNYFGADNIALWHSNLSDGERADTWRKLQAGELRILIGARSAVWVPMKNLGMILIDEEHDGSYKQDSPAPRYNAKVLARELAHRTGARLVLGSATPEVSTFYEARAEGRILHLPERFGGRNMAEVRIADMKQEKSNGNTSYLSRELQEELRRNLESGEQSIILLNRRGFYTTIQCNVCDYVFMCPNCDVAVTYHRSRNQVCCHYCGYENESPKYCPVCASMELSHSGVGTQRIEDEVLKKFPEARVLRLDSDVMQRKHAYREIFETFSHGEADILIGTQMVAKGLDIANVTLVGVVTADSAFALPDYKSAERGFQLLTQVAGRSGRGEKQGRVVIQAVQTQHWVLEYASRQDYPGFYEQEIQNRELTHFPPYSQLFRFIISCENERKGRQFTDASASHLRAWLRERDLDKQILFLGPAPCVLPRIQGRYRFHYLLKNMAGEAGHRAINDFYRRADIPQDINFILDIDAQSLL